MRFASWTSYGVAVLALVSLLAGPLAIAQQTQAPATTQSSPAATEGRHPTRGMTMEKVEATFGAPANRQPAVGQPPITRWEYPGFVVYFEHRIVLHTVLIG